MGYCNYTSFQTRCHKVKKMDVVVICTWGVYFSSVRYDFRIKTMFSSSFPPVVCRRTMCVYLCTKVSNTYCVVYLICFSSSCVTCVALDCPFPNIYLTSFFKINSGEVYSIQQYAIKVVDNLRPVGGFLFGLQSFFLKIEFRNCFKSIQL
jgi:hypothetical protein